MNTRISGLLSISIPLLAFLAVSETSLAQVRQPIASPYAKVMEEVGLTDITIRYARPAVNGREIWGGLVPNGLTSPLPNFGNGESFPWRAGANTNTTISFEHDVLIEGQKLPAGIYGLHMIPSEAEWIIVFNNDANYWGSFFYEESNDALRVTVTPEKAPFKERLAYEFIDQDGQGALTIALLWEEKKVPFRVTVDDYHNVVLAEMSDELFARGGFNQQNYVALANYALLNNADIAEGMKWAERAITSNRNFVALRLKAGFMMQAGQVAEAVELMAEPIEGSTENELNAYGYQLMGTSHIERALGVFHLNIKRHPDAWNPHDSLGDCYNRMSDNSNARKYYQLAIDKLPENDQANRDRIEQILGTIST
jgi:tetratricopeptide (TPR) repeat protein